MQKVDVQYLGTVHPFKGVRVYTCDPQGCKGASERGYEKLVRIYGDMIQDEKLAQMADGLHVLGKTVDADSRLPKAVKNLEKKPQGPYGSRDFSNVRSIQHLIF